MSKNICIPIGASNALRKAIQSGKFTIDDLATAKTSSDRRKVFERFLDTEDAKVANGLFEGAMVKEQKGAMRDWIWKNIYGKRPLYRELSLEQSEAMRNAGLTGRGFAKMSETERVATLSKYVEPQVAEKLNERFMNPANRPNWEEKVLGTKELFEDKRLKGAFNKLEVLDELGYLTPAQSSKFMEDLVATKLGIEITVKEAAKISELVKATTKSFDDMQGNILYTNRENVLEYFKARRALEDYSNSLNPASSIAIFTDVGARGALLYSFRSVMNSFAFQAVPGFTRSIVKRFASASQLPGDYNVLQKLYYAMSSLGDLSDAKFAYKQGKLGVEIYHKTGYDISRMQNLSDGLNFFGEKFTHTQGPSIKEIKTMTGYLSGGVRLHGRMMEGGLKYAAGGSDAIFANLHRADTTAMLARISAKAEKKAGILPKGMTEDQRFMQLVEESYSFNPQSDQAKYIREMGITDAHYANGTQNEWYGVTATKIREALNFGDYKIGSALMPFLRIPANMLGTGLQASGHGLITGAQQALKALRLAKGSERSIEVAKGLSKMMVSGGLLGSAIFLASLFDKEDYVGAYDWKQRSKNQLDATKGAGGNYVRIGGNWYSTRWLGPLAIPFNAMMKSKQSSALGENATHGYLKGVVLGMMDFPGISQIGNLYGDAGKAASAKDLAGSAKALNLTPEQAGKWIAQRTIPSVISHDAWAFTKEPKSDALGRNIPHRSDSVGMAVASMLVGSNVKIDTSNTITREFDRLYFKGKLPVMTNPTGAKVDAAIEKLGEEGYERKLNTLKQNYAKEVEILLSKPSYKKLSPEGQKKAIDTIRQREILDKI